MCVGFEPETSLMITCVVIAKSPMDSVLTNLDAQIAMTDGLNATIPWISAIIDTAQMNAGFRPIESSKDPKAGEIIISVSAAVDPSMDNVDVARSDPIASMRNGAGEKATKDEATIVRKDDV